MRDILTPAGTVRILSREEAFAELVRRLEARAAHGRFTVGLSGGSTPKAFYAWAAAGRRLSDAVLTLADWHVSDERCVPLTSDDSNFGHAVRGLLDPLGVPSARRFPWPVELAPEEAAVRYVAARAPGEAFDLCVLGLGDDAHIAGSDRACSLDLREGERQAAQRLARVARLATALAGGDGGLVGRVGPVGLVGLGRLG